MLFERRKIAMVVAEFLGTALLTAVILAVSKSSLALPYFVSIAAALAAAAGMVVFGAISGAHLNPVVTIGLWTARKIKTWPAIAYVIAQLLGGAAAYLLYTYLIDSSLRNASEYNARVLVAEAVGAFIFVLGWATVVYRKLELGKSAFAVGSALFLGMLVASMGSAGLLNPAVALAAHTWVWGTYVLGPILGGIIGFNLYALLFAPPSTLTDDVEDKEDKPAVAAAEVAKAKSTTTKNSSTKKNNSSNSKNSSSSNGRKKQSK
ncbi:aquaporin [Candidatus Saccharibacteria bacterium]|nr:aquaporin [Candidatus Saccharibacteria bacterium]